MRNQKNLIGSESQYNRHYSNMRGVDFTGDGSNIQSDRFAYLENMYRDYEGEGAGISLNPQKASARVNPQKASARNK